MTFRRCGLNYFGIAIYRGAQLIPVLTVGSLQAFSRKEGIIFQKKFGTLQFTGPVIIFPFDFKVRTPCSLFPPNSPAWLMITFEGNS